MVENSFLLIYHVVLIMSAQPMFYLYSISELIEPNVQLVLSK